VHRPHLRRANADAVVIALHDTLASSFRDERNQELVMHRLRELLAQREYAIER
jgi:hypothetical protein